MSLFVPLLLFIFFSSSNAQGNPPSPGFSPGSLVSPIAFDQGFKTLWGSQNQRLDQNSLTMWLDKSSGSGFKSIRSYKSGYFGTSIKLHPGYTAGVITSFYLSNNEDHPGNHDEVDIEFLGTTPDKPYTLQTNVYIRGSGDGKIIGREEQFHLWFDPTKDFHDYAMLWTPKEIIFFVDDVPIRQYLRESDTMFPLRPMYVYGSIWDASSWATENGKYKANYGYQPFVSRYNNFKIRGCEIDSEHSCQHLSGFLTTIEKLRSRQVTTMQWVQKNYKVYDYCGDPERDHSLTPEC